MKQVHLWISGRVQGVTYRASTRRKARELGVDGWVKNLPDGRVEAVFCGDQDAVDTLIEWCHDGPGRARVDSVDVESETPDTGFAGFEIRY